MRLSGATGGMQAKGTTACEYIINIRVHSTQRQLGRRLPCSVAQQSTTARSYVQKAAVEPPRNCLWRQPAERAGKSTLGPQMPPRELSPCCDKSRKLSHVWNVRSSPLSSVCMSAPPKHSNERASPDANRISRSALALCCCTRSPSNR